jgi:phospholipid transport system substrate-binding protein
MASCGENSSQKLPVALDHSQDTTMSIRSHKHLLAASLLAGFAALGALSAVPPAEAAADPAGFVADLGSRAIGVLTSQMSDADREAHFRQLFEEGFDVPAISRFVLGPYWRTASDAQQQEFIKLFEAYEVHAYSVRFSAYTGQQLKVVGSRPEGDKGALVLSQIANTDGGAPVKVDWRVSGGDGSYKMTDVMVEGVSMALTERQQFASVIQRGGGQLEVLLKLLREKTGQS